MFFVDAAQHIGSRESQQDYYAVEASCAATLVVVCDGLSGWDASAAAAESAARGFALGWRVREHLTPDQRLEGALIEAAEPAVNALGGAGTTLVAAAVGSDGVHWISVGDSPLLLFSGGRLSLLNELHHDGGPSAPPSSYLGFEPVERIDRGWRPVDWARGDTMLLATDGLTQSLNAAAMEALFAADPSPSPRALIRRALAASSARQDNITVVTIRAGQPA